MEYCLTTGLCKPPRPAQTVQGTAQERKYLGSALEKVFTSNAVKRVVQASQHSSIFLILFNKHFYAFTIFIIEDLYNLAHLPVLDELG
jgi:hypothetical protein